MEKVSKKEIEIAKTEVERLAKIRCDNEIRPYVSEVDSLKRMLADTNRKFKETLDKIENLGHVKAEKEH